ncbi:MAG: molybdenum cofactor biosynthesis protein MoaE [Planctomycetaceae bacterium]
MTEATCIDIIELTEKVIDYVELTEEVRSHQSGAVILFLGTVREMTDGRKTLCLDYEAYPEMALAKLRELSVETRTRWPVDRLGIVHRLGHLELGEISVAVAVGCPHRRDAFEAGQYLIDRLKEVVPIWKKENWSDGSTEWVHPGSGSPIPLLKTEGEPPS